MRLGERLSGWSRSTRRRLLCVLCILYGADRGAGQIRPEGRERALDHDLMLHFWLLERDLLGILFQSPCSLFHDSPIPAPSREIGTGSSVRSRRGCSSDLVSLPSV